jgi:hypothetical protein
MYGGGEMEPFLSNGAIGFGGRAGLGFKLLKISGELSRE